MGPLRRIQAILWSRKRLEELSAQGISYEDALETLDQEGADRYGAIDWLTLLPLILKLLELLAPLFARRTP